MTIVVGDDATPEQVAETITHLARDAARLPAHWVDRKAEIHAEINRLLYIREAMLATSAANGLVGA